MDMPALKDSSYWSVLAVCGLVTTGALIGLLSPESAKKESPQQERIEVQAPANAAGEQKISSQKASSAALAKARKRITRYGDAEGWDRIFLKTGTLNKRGYVCGTLYGETDKSYGWNFTVRFIYDPDTDEINVLNWAMINHDAWFDSEWAAHCSS